MIKYYGFIYSGRNAIYNIEEELSFDNLYDALKKANDNWNSNPDYQIPRLLVVIALEDNSNSPSYAFFQFTNSKSCENFIVDQNEVIWSTNEKQVWNGNAKMM